MSKKGKIIGVAALVLSIVAVVFAVFCLKLSKQHADRYAELASTTVEVSSILGSSSGVSNQLSFGISDGKETGSLGWESTKGVAGATKKAAAPLEDLAQNVVDQRDKIISDVIEKVAIPLECPVDKRPQPTVLNNLNEYASGLEAFSAFVRARVARDNNLKSQLNQVLRLLNVREAYSGRITENGALDNKDVQAFRDAAKNLSALKANYTQFANFARDLTKILRKADVRDVTWASANAGNSIGNTGLSEAEKASNENAIQKLREDLKTLEAQLARINNLEDEKAQLIAERDEALKKAAEWEEAWRTDEAVLKSIMDTVTPSGNYNPNPITSKEQINSDISGAVLGTNAEFGYVVTSLTHGEVVEGVRLSIFRSGKYIAMIRVIKVTPFNSLAVIEDGSVSAINRNDTVLLASPILQP